MMRNWTRHVAMVAVIIVCLGSMARGAITFDGNVTPARWYSSTRPKIGETGWGSVTVDSGSDLNTLIVYLGYYSGSTGLMTVTGTGSTWTNSAYIDIGHRGDGALHISNGGLVEIGTETWLARVPGSTGAINLDNGTLTTNTLLGSGSNLSGVGTINTNGLVSNMDLVFHSGRGPAQTFTLDGPGQNITVNLNMDGSALTGAGYDGAGSMRISDGVTVQSTYGYLGYHPGSTGVVTVSDGGSTWANSEDLYVGLEGDGMLDITNGAAVSNRGAEIGSGADSAGSASLSGSGSTWNNSGGLFVGSYGTGRLDIANGAAVSNTYGWIGWQPGSTGAVTVSGPGANWTNSSNITVGGSGDGAMSITNGASVSNTYARISALFDVHVLDRSTGAVTVSGPGSTWTNSGSLSVAANFDGALHITDGGAVSNTHATVGIVQSAVGAVTVSGEGSSWTSSGTLCVAYDGQAAMEISDGAVVTSEFGCIARDPRSTGTVTVSGEGSTWRNADGLFVGESGNATLRIEEGGLVSSAGYVKIAKRWQRTSFIAMATGGKLALYGRGDDSLGSFMELIFSGDDIRYFNESIGDWDHITSATRNVDYTLDYLTSGDLDGYTVLTVNTIPEPTMIAVLATGGLALIRGRRKE